MVAKSLLICGLFYLILFVVYTTFISTPKAAHALLLIAILLAAAVTNYVVPGS